MFLSTQLADIAKHAIDNNYNNVTLKVSGDRCTFKASKDKIPKKTDYFKYFLIILEVIKKFVSFLTFFSNK